MSVIREPAADEPGMRLQITRPRPGHDCKLSGCCPHVCKPMAKGTIRGIHAILSGAFEAAMRWEWTDRNPAASARPPTPRRQTILATSPEAVAKVIAGARVRSAALGLYLWLVMVTGVRRGELCGLQIRDVDLDRALVHIAFNYVVRGGRRVRKDTKTHQDRWLAIDLVTCALIVSYLAEIRQSSRRSAAGCERTRTCFPTTQRMPGRGTRTGSRTGSLRSRLRPGLSSTSRAGGITPRASSWLAGSTCGTLPPASATAGAARPRCGTTPTRSPRWTAAPRPTLHS
jgi:integrase